MPLVQNSTFTSFDSYLDFLKDLVDQGRTTGPDQSDHMVEFTKLNLHRIQRVLKTMEFLPEVEATFRALRTPLKWRLLAETWCGDAAQLAPAIAALAGLSENIQFELLLRDENLAFMDQHLTNGGRAIPKLIMEDMHGNVLATWGPRPQGALDLVKELKARAVKPSHDELVVEIQKWYAKDKTHSVQRELAALIADL